MKTRLIAHFHSALTVALFLPVGSASYGYQADEKAEPEERAGQAERNDPAIRAASPDQRSVAQLAEKSGVKTQWHPQLGTPLSIRGSNLGQRRTYSGGKGLALLGGKNYERDAIAVVDNLSRFYRVRDAEKEFAVKQLDQDSLGFHHVSLAQVHRGLRVVGGDLKVHFDKNGQAYQVSGQYVPDIEVEVLPKLDANEARRIAQGDLAAMNKPEATLEQQPTLVVFARDAGPHLAYELVLRYDDLKTGPARWRFWIDAQQGTVLLRYNDIKKIAPPTANGTNAFITGSILAGEGGQSISVTGRYENTGYFYLYNTNRKWHVFNVAISGYPDNDTYAYRSNSLWGTSDRAEMSAARNFDIVQRYYLEVHGRSSFNNSGIHARANVHEGIGYVNAFWNGTDFHFGDGDGVAANSLATLDICGHEFTHAVTEYTANLIYAYESGALNESFSDIIGACVEIYGQPDGRSLYPSKSPGTADWLNGEDCWLSSTALRDMRNPGNTATVGAGNEQPSRYRGTYWYSGTGDNGGVHYNSGVQNFFFYLLSEGGSGNNDGIFYSVAGIGITNAEQVAYRALTVYCTPNTDYQAVRGAWLSAAMDLNTNWVEKVSAAWSAVGIGAMYISPDSAVTFRGPVGGPFSPPTQTYSLLNRGSVAMDWGVIHTQSWTTVAPTNGTIPAGGSNLVTVAINAAANGLPMGIYSNSLVFSNSVDAASQPREVKLLVGQPDYFTELFDAADNDLDFQTWTFTPDGSARFYTVCRDVATNFPTDPAGGTIVTLSDDSFAQVTLSGMNTVAIYNRRTNVFFIGSNGYLTMNAGDSGYTESFSSHFARPRVSACFDDLNPSSGGTVSWKQASDRAAVSFSSVREYGSSATVSFQIELFYDGRIRLTYLAVGVTDGLAGLSAGDGLPAGFIESDLSTYSICPPPDDLVVTPNVGLASQGYQGGPFAPSSTSYVLKNVGTNSLAWTVTATQPWLNVSATNGSLDASASTNIVIDINSQANLLGPGSYADTVTFSNLSSGFTQTRSVSLRVLAIPGEIAVLDSVPPATDLQIPFGEVIVGLSRTEHITVRNTNATHDLLISGVHLARPSLSVNLGSVSGRVGTALSAPPADSQNGLKQNLGESSALPPSALRWNGPLSSDAAILVYADDPGHPSPNTYVDQALYLLGLSYTAYYNGAFAGFETALNSSGPWDLVVFANDNDACPESTLNALLSYVNNGGSLIAHTWRMSAHPSHGLWPAMGAAFVSDDTTPPDPVYWWEAAHVLFTNPEQVPMFTNLTAFGYSIYGQRLRSLAGNSAPAGYTTTSDTNSAAIVLGASGRTILRGFLDAQNQADRDSDGKPDGVELWVNMISRDLAPEGFEVARLPALPHTLAPGSNLTFDVIYAPTAAGSNAGAVVIESNDADEPRVEVQVTGQGILDYLRVTPATGFASQGHPGGPFSPSSASYIFSNAGPIAVAWTSTHTQSWVNVLPAGGALVPGESASVTVGFTGAANSLPVGTHHDLVNFIDLTTTVSQPRKVSLTVFTSPQIVVAPASMSVTNALGGSTNIVLSVSNALTADGNLTFSISAHETGRSILSLAVAGVALPPADRDFTKAAPDKEFASDRLLVRFAAGVQPVERAQMLNALGGSQVIRDYKVVPGLCLVKLPAGQTVEQALLTYNRAAGILYAEPDYQVKANVTVPNDARFSELWGLHNTGQSGGTSDADIDAPEAWDLNTGSRQVVVAVIDTGVDYNHLDLTNNIWTNLGEIPGNSVDDDGNGFVDDVHGYDFVNDDGDPRDDNDHGTHVAGTIGAEGNNGIGVAGVCWQVRIMGLKFLDADGGGSTANAISAIEYATLMGVRVMNNSWGGGPYAQSLKDAIDAAGAAGSVFVAAAGNDGINNDTTPHYPSSYVSSNIVAVMSTDHNDARPTFSNYGQTSVDLAAPGTSILSCQPGGAYQKLSGTSMATPHVAGACALLLSANPILGVAAIKEALLSTVDPTLSGQCVSGGRLNLARALSSVGAAWLTVTPSGSTNVVPGGSVSVTVGFQADELAAGTYSGQIVITCNDLINPTVTVPVTMTILPDDLQVTPTSAFVTSGAQGGPFMPSEMAYTLTNRGASSLNWQIVHTQSWVSVSPNTGMLPPGTSLVVTGSINSAANLLAAGQYADSLVFSNSNSGGVQPRAVNLSVVIPVFSIADASVLEGDDGQTNMMFSVQLSPVSSQTVTVNFATTNGTAQAGTDYLATNGLLTFTPGQTTTNVIVAVLGDTNAEPNEAFLVNLSNATNAMLARAQATGTILSDDLGPFFDDFEPGIDLLQWSAFGGSVGSTVLATNYGGFVSSVNSLWFGAATNRYAASRSLNTAPGGVVDFWLRIASGTSDTWETADLPGEGIVLEYSINGGSTWVEFGRYDTTSYRVWTHVTVDIPVGAQAGNTQFRWRQLSNSGTGYDHWALDDVGAAIGPQSPKITSQPASQTVLLGGTATFNVGASGSLPLFYQWHKDGTNLVDGGRISGAASNRLTIVNLQTNDAGLYSVVVTNDYPPAALSSNAVLTVEIPQPPSVLFGPIPTNNATGVSVHTLLSWNGGSAQQYRLFAIRDGADGMYVIDPTTAVPTLRGPSGVSSSTCGLTESGGAVLYGSTWSQLSVIQADGSGVLTRGSQGMEGMAYAAASGVLYGALNGSFFTIDPATGNRLTTLPSWPDDCEGLAFVPNVGSQGSVFGIDDDGELHRYDIALGTFSLVGITGLGSASALSGLAYAPDLDVLFHITRNNGNLYRIDVGTAAATLVGNTGISGSTGFSGLGYGPDTATGAITYSSHQCTLTSTPGLSSDGEPLPAGICLWQAVAATGPQNFSDLEGQMDLTTGKTRVTGNAEIFVPRWRGETGGAVLWDLTHGVFLDYQPSGSFSTLVSLLAGNGFTVNTTSTGVTNLNLAAFDVLVICVGSAWNSAYSSAEVAAIQSFVAGGGGLIVLSDNPATPNANLNPVASLFGVTCGTADVSSSTLSTFINHPALLGCSQITIPAAGALSVVPPTSTIGWASMGQSVIAAYDGIGKVLLLGDINAWDNANISRTDNQRFAENVFDWAARASSGPGIVYYSVYFGTNPTTMTLIASNLTQTTCDPGTLAFNTTYHWQVVASNVVGSVTGAVWQFTTTLDEVHFASATSSVAENGGSALITVVRENPAGGALSVQYSATNGTATAGSDYTAVSGTLTFAAGVMSTNFQVPILEDSMGEGNETILLRLRQPSANVLLASPSNAVVTIVDNDAQTVSLPYNLYDNYPYLWDIQRNGSISDGTSDAYDGGHVLSGFPDFTSGLLVGGREVIVGPASQGGLQISRRIYVPGDHAYARFLEVMHNPGGSPITTTVRIDSNLGSDSSTVLVGTSSGDTVFGTNDNWIVTDDTDGSGDPTVLHVVANNSGAIRPSSVSYSTGTLGYQYSVTVPPGETRMVMHFGAQNQNRATALAKAPQLASLQQDALAQIAPDDWARIVNFGLSDGLLVSPAEGLVSSGYEGGPFNPSNKVFTLLNTGASNLNWTASCTQVWVTVEPAGGDLPPSTSTNVTVLINTNAHGLSNGLHLASIIFSNRVTGVTQTRGVQLSLLDSNVLTVAVFDNPLYVDTAGTTSSESDNVQASLSHLGFQVFTFSNILAATATHTILLFPEFEVRSLALDLTGVERGALSSFVAGGGLIIVHGHGTNAGAFINTVFGLAVVETSQSAGGTVFTRTASSVGTEFADDPLTITGNNGQITLNLSSLPPGSLNIYGNGAQSAVTELLWGNGKVIYLGWDWFDAAPAGTQDGGWLTVLESSVLEGRPATPPTITCPDNIAVECWADIPPVDLGAVAATNNCGPVTTSHVGDSSMTNGCVLTVTRTYRATDSCGNSSECQQTITVEDTMAPTLTCAPAKTVECCQPWSFDDPTASDNCGPVSVTVLSTITNGFCPLVVTRTWQATDPCGNSGICGQTITVGGTANPQVTGQVQLHGFVGVSRTVTFVATGGLSNKTWNVALNFTGGVADYTLTDVPPGTTCLDAKTAWTLRRKRPVTIIMEQATANFTGASQLLGGDLDGNNQVNFFDYAVLAANYLTTNSVADITGDGMVNFTDYAFLTANYFIAGDSE